MSRTNLMYVLVPGGASFAPGDPERVLPLAAAAGPGGNSAILFTAVTVLSGGSGTGFPVSIVGLTDNDDEVAPLDPGFSELYMGVVNRPTVFNPATELWDRARAIPDNSDEQPPVSTEVIGGVMGVVARLQGFEPLGESFYRLVVAADDTDIQDTSDVPNKLITMARGQLFNGAAISAWNRSRDASAPNLGSNAGTGVQIVSGAGEWALNDQPAAATQATVTRPAAGAGNRNVCKSITVSIAAVAAQAPIVFNLRDGASGAGTILWSVTLIAPAGSGRDVVLTGLNIVGSEDTDMTLESAAAPAGTNFANVSLTGFTAFNA